MDGAFVGIALLLSAMGVCGMLAYDASRRTRAIGIRGTIRATREEIVGMILRRGVAKTGLGPAFARIGAYALSRYTSSRPFGVKPTAPLPWVAMALLLLVIAALASWLPAWRGTQFGRSLRCAPNAPCRPRHPLEAARASGQCCVTSATQKCRGREVCQLRKNVSADLAANAARLIPAAN